MSKPYVLDLTPKMQKWEQTRIEFVEIKKLWIDGKQIEIITLHPTPYAIKVD